MRILLTGGLGFIGSHVAVTLGQQDHDIIIIDNLANSSIDVLFKIKRLIKYPERIYYSNYSMIKFLFYLSYYLFNIRNRS